MQFIIKTHPDIPESKLMRKFSAHIWTGEDTVCKLVERNAINLVGKTNLYTYAIVPDVRGRKLCVQCQQMSKMDAVEAPKLL